MRLINIEYCIIYNSIGEIWRNFCRFRHTNLWLANFRDKITRKRIMYNMCYVLNMTLYVDFIVVIFIIVYAVYTVHEMRSGAKMHRQVQSKAEKMTNIFPNWSNALSYVQKCPCGSERSLASKSAAIDFHFFYIFTSRMLSLDSVFFYQLKTNFYILNGTALFVYFVFNF